MCLFVVNHKIKGIESQEERQSRVVCNDCAMPVLLAHSLIKRALSILRSNANVQSSSPGEN